MDGYKNTSATEPKQEVPKAFRVGQKLYISFNY